MNDKSTPSIHNGHVLGAAAVLFVPMAILLSKSIAPLFAVTAVAVLVLGVLRRRAVPLIPGPVAISLAALVAWSLLTWVWSITPGETLKTGISLAGTFFGGAVLAAAAAGLDGHEKRIFQNGLIIGGAVGFPLIAFELFSDAWLTQYLFLEFAKKYVFNFFGDHTPVLNTGLAATALYFWPWALTMWSRFSAPVAGLAIAVAFGLILMSFADAVILGFSAGTVVFVAGLVLYRQLPWIMGVAVAVGVLAAPMVPGLLPNPLKTGQNLSWLSPSAAHRIVIWKNTVGHIKQKPILGGGFDTARGLYSGKDKVLYRFPKEIVGQAYQVQYEPIPLHPHNAVLQVWLELGGVGALILLGLLLAVVHAIFRQVKDRFERSAALAMYTTALVLASLSFGAWQSWWLTSILLAAAFVVSMIDLPIGVGEGSGKSAGNGAPADKEPALVAEEIGGPQGPEPTRYGDWEKKGRAIDF